MNKLKVLVLVGDADGGVGYYRTLSPHLVLDKHDIECDVRLLTDYTIPLLDENYLKNFNIIFYNKIIPLRDDAKAIFLNILKKYNIKLVYDIDDYWILDPTHLNYSQWKSSKSSKIVEETIKQSDWVVTTTPLFADIIKKINPNVFVIENAVNLNEMQWTSNKIKSDKIRFLWGGGISHLSDLRVFADDFKLFKEDFLSKTQMYMCGYDLRMRTNDGIRMDDPRRSQWTHFESIFTNNLKWITNPNHKDFLMKFNHDNVTYGINDEFKDEWYQRRITKPILTYGTMYNEADVCLAPLKNQGIPSFNYAKSQLKVIEAGAHKCPIICSNFGPYTIDDIEGKNDKIQKGFLINENEKGKWYEKMKWYSENPTAVKEHGEALHEYVKNNYSLDILSKKRADFYKKIISE